MSGGRVPDIAMLRSLFATSRLTTVTGCPGAGKSAVTAAAAAGAAGGFRDGMRVVPLHELPDEALLAHAVMRTVGVPDRPSLPQAEALCHGLRESRSLLVLDGCDHLARDCAGLVRRLLRHCPWLHIAVTSAEPLGVAGEEVYPLALDLDLDLDPALDPALDPHSAGGTLGAGSGEAAAASLVGLSHQLCGTAARLLWARMSVFGTEFALDDAVGVCADQHLRAADIPGAARDLARRSLLIPVSGTGRYRIPEPVREYGAMMLRELGEEAGTLGKYRAWREVRR